MKTAASWPLSVAESVAAGTIECSFVLTRESSRDARRRFEVECRCPPPLALSRLSGGAPPPGHRDNGEVCLRRHAADAARRRPAPRPDACSATRNGPRVRPVRRSGHDPRKPPGSRSEPADGPARPPWTTSRRAGPRSSVSVSSISAPAGCAGRSRSSLSGRRDERGPVAGPGLPTGRLPAERGRPAEPGAGTEVAPIARPAETRGGTGPTPSRWFRRFERASESPCERIRSHGAPLRDHTAPASRCGGFRRGTGEFRGLGRPRSPVLLKVASRSIC